MQNLNHPDTLEHWQLALEQARAFLPDDPMNAWERLRQLERQLVTVLAQPHEPCAALDQLAACLGSLVPEAHAASELWQQASTRRQEHFHARELSPALRH